MPNIPLFRYDPPVVPSDQRSENVPSPTPPAPGTVSLTPTGAAGVLGVLIALIGAFSPFVSSCMTAEQQKRQEERQVRTERITRETAWLKSALAVEKRDERDVAMKFLVRAKLVEDSDGALATIVASEIPYLAPTAPTPPAGQQDIQNTTPPAPGAPARRGSR